MGRRLPRSLGPLVLLLLALLVGSAYGQGDIVKEIVVRGNVNIESAKILGAVTQIKVGEPYTEQALQQDVNAVQNMGFFEPGVVYGIPEPVEGGVRIVVEVTEYPKVTAVEFVGNTVLTAEELSGDQGIILRAGDVFNFFTLRRGVENIEALYAERGYRGPVSEVEAPLEGQRWDGVLRVHIVEAVVENIEVVGLRKTEERVVRLYIRVQPKDLYNMYRVRDDQLRLINTGFFDEEGGVKVSIKQGTDFGKIVLVFEFQEKSTGTVNLGLGYSSRDKVVGFTEVTELNLRGRGQQANLRWEFGGVSSYELGFTEPWINDRHWGLTVNLFNKLLNRNIASEFAAAGIETTRNEKRTGGNVTLAVPMDEEEKIWTWVTLRHENVAGRYDSEGLSIIEPFYTQGRVASMALKGVYDTRDYFNYPTQGWRNSATLELAGTILGGERAFSKYSVDVRKYVATGRGQVAAGRLLVGTVAGDIPLFETFVVGGAETLRGFGEDRFWGKNMFLLNLEYRIPLDRPDRRSLVGVVFLDLGDAWGGVWNTADHSVVYPAEHQSLSFRVGYGVGLRVATPVGPIRMDIGFSREGQEPHISIGQMF